jgi:predicted PurR-regulated permease PerM
MNYADFIRRAITVIVLVAAFVLLERVISEVSSLLVLIFAAWVFSVGLSNAVDSLQQRGMRGRIAVALVLGLTILAFVLVAAIILPVFASQISNLVEEIPDAIDSLIDGYNDLRDNSETAAAILPEISFDRLELINDQSLDDIAAGEDPAAGIALRDLINSIVPVLGGTLGLIGGIMANLFLLTTITLYLFANPMVYYRALLLMVPPASENQAVSILNEIRQAISAWMGSLALSIFIVSTLTAFFLGVIYGIPNALAMGILAGLAGFIPNLGYYLGLIPIALFTLVYNPVLVIPAWLTYALINEFDGKILQPRLTQKTLSIPAGIVLPFQLISAALFGFFGIMLAIPILAMTMILVRELYVVNLLGRHDLTSRLEKNKKGQLFLTMETGTPIANDQPVTEPTG